VIGISAHATAPISTSATLVAIAMVSSTAAISMHAPERLLAAEA
jgi:hypothetical protein